MKYTIEVKYTPPWKNKERCAVCGKKMTLLLKYGPYWSCWRKTHRVTTRRLADNLRVRFR